MKPCKRTRCIWRSGEPIEGFFCSYAYSGRIPCTGAERCHYCGQAKEDSACSAATAAIAQ